MESLETSAPTEAETVEEEIPKEAMDVEEVPAAVDASESATEDEQQASSSAAEVEAAQVEEKASQKEVKDVPEEDTVSSTADSETSKAKASRGLAVEVTHFQMEANHIIEYEWPDRSGERYFLQEQIAELLDVKSFKRKYAAMFRRNVEPDERKYLETEHNLSSRLPSHLLPNLTALSAAEVHNLMAQEYPEQHAKYQKVVVERRRREQRNALTTKVDKRPLAERMKEACQEAASYNKEFNTWRAPGYMDIQTMVCQYPKNQFSTLPKELTKPSVYPCALIHGQYSEYYKRITPEELKRFPFGTVCDSTDLFPVRREASPPGVSVSETEQAVLDAAAEAEAAANEQNKDESPEAKKEAKETTARKAQATPKVRKMANLATEDEATPANKRKRPAPASTNSRRPKKPKKEESEDEEDDLSGEDEELVEKVTASGRRPVRSCATRKSYAKLLIDD